ncbi:hypothetical protein IM792_06135 [Mucilaginibacter sp. JRF]|uniref:hypothetical protein n=1 Tax=Mucilaginibacter sp. JRF TaxID=2780088 RepID=UPI00187FC6FC|nr:hypothetical protein [Mucilaginibacter sp. JRF]MBE9584022.1 hypothetical protein [Mucilaginibacter sp. JRF]
MTKTLNHSIENIYIQVGQYDRYAIFDFYYNSSAFLKYGSTVHGLIIYTPLERATLEEAIMPGNNSNNDGLIKLDVVEDNPFYKELRTSGFYARDISRLSALDSRPIEKVYKSSLIKEIPNTVEIKFKSNPSKLHALEHLNFTNRIERGLPLLPNEKQRYTCLNFLIHPNEATWAEVKKILDDNKTNTVYDDVVITIWSYYHNFVDNNDSSAKLLLNTSLKKRRVQRTEFILKHLGISIKVLDAFKGSNYDSWKELMGVVMSFETTVIDVWGWTHPVWWDFERFIHIYLRHYKGFFLTGSSKGQGTSFQYHYRDIRRLIEIIIRNHKIEIENCLKANKPYNRYDEQGYYYNGNYYTFRIDKSGRLMQFHPQEN